MNIIEKLKKWWFTTENLFSFTIDINLLNINIELYTPLFKFEFDTFFPEFHNGISLRKIFSKALSFNEYKSGYIDLEFWSDLTTGITIHKSIIPKHIHSDHFLFAINILGLSFTFCTYDNRRCDEDEARTNIGKMITDVKKRWRDGQGWWNYRVLEEVINNAPNFRIIEVHYDDRGNIYGWADSRDRCLAWDNYGDLKGTCEYLKEAFEMPVLKRGEEDSLYVENDN